MENYPLANPHNLHNLTSIDAPFKLILDDESALEIDVIVRRIPNKRLVCRAKWQQQIVYAKLFLGNDSKRYCLRDRQGVKYLLDAKIASPKILHEGAVANTIATKSVEVLIFEAIVSANKAPALNAEQLWPSLNIIQRIELFKKMVLEVAKHHNAKLIQADIHLKNFLIAGITKNNEIADATIYTIDGDGILQTNSKRKKRDNLAIFLSKFDALDDEFMREIIETYYLAVGQTFNIEAFTKIYFLTKKMRQKAACDYADKKVFRNCTDVTVTKSSQRFLAVSRHFNINKQQLDILDDYLSNENSNIKNGNTCTIGVADFVLNDRTNKKVVIKRYNVKSFWHGVKFLFKKSRAAKSWANAHRLQIYNIVTPQPLALIEQKVGMFKKCYFLSEYINAPDIAEFFVNEKNTELKQLVANNVAQLFYKMSLLKMVHGDCKASNIKIANGKPILLDLDSLFVVKGFLPYTHQHVKDLKRFMQNWQSDIETTTLLKTAFKFVYEMEDNYFAVPNALDAAGIN